MLANIINWFEIPTHNLERAKHFYEQIFNLELKTELCSEMKLAVFPYPDPQNADSQQPNGCLCECPGYQPGQQGTIIYLNCREGIDTVLARLKKLAQPMIKEKTALPPGMGHFAIFQDSEGNAIGIHSL